MRFVQTVTAKPVRYRESRRDQRLVLPRFHAVIAGHVLPTANWSLSGLLLRGPAPPGLRSDILVTGILNGEMQSGPETVRFAARLIRLAAAPRGVALSFVEDAAEVVEFLEACLRHRLLRGSVR